MESDQGFASGPESPTDAQLAAIVSLAADAIISVDEEQRITAFNRGAERIFGYSAEEVIGHSLDVLLPERFRAAHHRRLREFAASEERARRMGERLEIAGLRKSGEEFPGRRLHHQAANPAGVAVLGHPPRPDDAARSRGAGAPPGRRGSRPAGGRPAGEPAGEAARVDGRPLSGPDRRRGGRCRRRPGLERAGGGPRGDGPAARRRPDGGSAGGPRVSRAHRGALREDLLDAPIPPLEVLRTGQPLWIHSPDEYRERYPEAFAEFYRHTGTKAMAALPREWAAASMADA